MGKSTRPQNVASDAAEDLDVNAPRDALRGEAADAHVERRAALVVVREGAVLLQVVEQQSAGALAAALTCRRESVDTPARSTTRRETRSSLQKYV